MKKRRSYVAPVATNQNNFLKKLVKKITDPTRKKVDAAIKKSDPNSPLLQSTKKVQTAIIEDSPKGLAKGLALGGAVVTAGLAAPAIKTALKERETVIPVAAKPLLEETNKDGLKKLGTEFLETIVANKNNGPKNAATVQLEKMAEQILAEKQEQKETYQAAISNIDPMKIGFAVVALIVLFFMFKK